VRGNYAYVTDGALHVFDVTNPAAPSLVNTTISGQEPHIEGSHLFQVNGSQLDILDLAIPSTPSLVGSIAIAGAQDVEVVGNRAYVAANAGLVVVDVTNKAAPSIQGSVALDIEFIGPIAALQVAAVGDLAAVSGAWGAAMIDATNPAAPSAIWSKTIGQDFAFTDLASDGASIYGVRAHSFGLEIFDVTQPIAIGSANFTTGTETYLAVADGKVYVHRSYGASHLLQVDINDPTNPFVRTTVFLGAPPAETSGSLLPHALQGGIAVQDGLVYLGRFGGGLQILSADCSITTSVGPEPGDTVQSRPSLLGVWPNPMRTETHIALALPFSTRGAVRVFDVAGRQIWHRVVTPNENGQTRSVWNGRNSHGAIVPSGVYFVQLQWKGGAETKRVTLLR
jgi:hypothetical protein